MDPSNRRRRDRALLTAVSSSAISGCSSPRAGTRTSASTCRTCWKAGSRLTATVGVRVDFVRRFDVLRNLQRQSSTEVGPRAGFSYLLTSDAKNVLRGTYGKYHQQLMGTRNPVPSFGGNDAQGLRNTYDLDGNGTFETEFITPPVATTISSLQFDPDLHQPSFDEWTLGFRRQFPGQIAMDVAGIVKVNHDQFAQVDINGFYPGCARTSRSADSARSIRTRACCIG